MDKTYKLVEMKESPPPHINLNGLAELSTLSQMKIRVRSISDEDGKLVFNVKKEFVWNGCSVTSFLDLYDNTGRMAIRVKPVYGCLKNYLEIYVEDQIVAEVRMKGGCAPKFVVNDANGSGVLQISRLGFCQTRVLQIKDEQENQIGTITRIWNGWAKEISTMFSDNDRLLVDFPRDLGVQYKAAVIGFCWIVGWSH